MAKARSIRVGRRTGRPKKPTRRRPRQAPPAPRRRAAAAPKRAASGYRRGVETPGTKAYRRKYGAKAAECVYKSGKKKGKLKKGCKYVGGVPTPVNGKIRSTKRKAGPLKECQRRGKGGRIVLRKNWKYGKGGRCLRAKG